MFRKLRNDTKIGTVERRYGIDLNARSDAKIGNVMRRRGFDSVTQVVNAHRGKAKALARPRRIFLSFDAADLPQVQGFRLLARNPALQFDIYDGSIREPVNSDRSEYIKDVIRQRIKAASVVVCLIGNRTAWRDWVEWELEAAYRLRKGLCGVRLKGSHGQAPQILRDLRAPVARWDLDEIVAAIECAAAKRT